jgi:serine/threonine-protein kinase
MTTQPDIPGYTLISKIAEGGMANVWRARQEKLDRVVAIKIMDKDEETDEREVERFIYEARAAASLIHPYIVQVIDAGELEEFMYYVMEYVPGPTAGDVVDAQGVLPEQQVLKIASEVAEGLHYAWTEHKVVHCDIKPDNLLLHRDGRTKIADLGLAQVLGKETVSIEDDMTIGTPHYFAPEQALVEEPYDCRTDMYSLGATMYHLATGRLPFENLEPDEVASQQVHGHLPSPLELNKKLSKPFCGLVEKLMAKQTDDRYSSWLEVSRELKRVQEGNPLEFPPSSDIRSTVTHTPQQKVKAALKVARAPGESHGPGSSSRPHVRVGAGQAAAHALHYQPVPSIWTLVFVIAVVAGLLYGFTFLFV